MPWPDPRGLGGIRTKPRTVALLALIAIVLGLAALWGPWWEMRLSGPLLSSGAPNPLAADTVWEYTLFGWSVSIPMWEGYLPMPINTTYADYAGTPNLGSVFLIASVLMGAALLSGGAFVVLQLHPRRRDLPRHAWGLWILAGALAAAAVTYVALGTPAAANAEIVGTCPGGVCFRTPGTFQGFWGSATWPIGPDWYEIHSYGAGWGWYLAIGSAVLFLVAGVCARRIQRAKAEPGGPPASDAA